MDFLEAVYRSRSLEFWFRNDCCGLSKISFEVLSSRSGYLSIFLDYFSFFVDY